MIRYFNYLKMDLLVMTFIILTLVLFVLLFLIFDSGNLYSASKTTGPEINDADGVKKIKKYLWHHLDRAFKYIFNLNPLIKNIRLSDILPIPKNHEAANLTLLAFEPTSFPKTETQITCDLLLKLSGKNDRNNYCIVEIESKYRRKEAKKYLNYITALINQLDLQNEPWENIYFFVIYTQNVRYNEAISRGACFFSLKATSIFLSDINPVPILKYLRDTYDTVEKPNPDSKNHNFILPYNHFFYLVLLKQIGPLGSSKVIFNRCVALMEKIITNCFDPNDLNDEKSLAFLLITLYDELLTIFYGYHFDLSRFLNLKGPHMIPEAIMDMIPEDVMKENVRLVQLGIAAGKAEAAKRMIADGCDDALIQKYTKLELNEIAKLREDLEK